MRQLILFCRSLWTPDTAQTAPQCDNLHHGMPEGVQACVIVMLEKHYQLLKPLHSQSCSFSLTFLNNAVAVMRGNITLLMGDLPCVNMTLWVTDRNSWRSIYIMAKVHACQQNAYSGKNRSS